MSASPEFEVVAADAVEAAAQVKAWQEVVDACKRKLSGAFPPNTKTWLLGENVATMVSGHVVTNVDHKALRESLEGRGLTTAVRLLDDYTTTKQSADYITVGVARKRAAGT